MSQQPWRKPHHVPLTALSFDSIPLIRTVSASASTQPSHSTSPTDNHLEEEVPLHTSSDPDSDAEMVDRRMHRSDGKTSKQPLLASGDLERGRTGYDTPAGSAPPLLTRHSTLRSRSPDTQAKLAAKQKYTYAAFFLALSLISFTVQTETAVYIQHTLKWDKAYCMLWLTHGSWSLLWPTQLLILRVQKWKMPWRAFWRRHVYLIRTTAQMVETQELSVSRNQHSPVPYMLRMTAFITCALTVAGASWYVAVNLTTPSDLTAIYNCSAFFAYAFSVPILKEKLRLGKFFAVIVAILGVLIVAYGDNVATKHSSHSGGAPKNPENTDEAENRTVGNLIIGVGSILYGFYEVLYKRLACPVEGCSPGRGMIFANTFGSLIGCFTILVLWIPLPILHFTGIEIFELPTGRTAWYLLVSVLSNATFSGSFLILMSLTSPVLSSVAALLTIFIVAIVDWMLPGGEALKPAAIIGGLLIIGAFLLLAYSTWREMKEESKKREIDIDDDDDESDMDSDD